MEPDTNTNPTIMTETVVGKQVKKLLLEDLGVKDEQVTDGALLANDLGMDSLDKVELLMDIEDHFNIEIPSEDEGSFNDKTVGYLIEYIINATHDKILEELK